jgi:hypothetical protein
LGLSRGLRGQEGDREQRAGHRDEAGYDGADAEAVVEGAGRGLADSVTHGRLAVGGELAGDAVRRPDGLMGQAGQAGGQ